eukprot:8365291-Pyramimonas_sp.AAC.1
MAAICGLVGSKYLPPAAAAGVECLAVRSKVHLAKCGHVEVVLRLIKAKGIDRAWQVGLDRASDWPIVRIYP